MVRKDLATRDILAYFLICYYDFIVSDKVE